MWVFNGEEWIDESASEEKRTPDTVPPRDELVTEPQIAEVVPTPRTRNTPPPFPLP